MHKNNTYITQLSEESHDLMCNYVVYICHFALLYLYPKNVHLLLFLSALFLDPPFVPILCQFDCPIGGPPPLYRCRILI